VKPFKLGHVLMCTQAKENVYSHLENHTLLMTWVPRDAVTVHRYNNMGPIFSAHTNEITALKNAQKRVLKQCQQV